MSTSPSSNTKSTYINTVSNPRISSFKDSASIASLHSVVGSTLNNDHSFQIFSTANGMSAALTRNERRDHAIAVHAALFQSQMTGSIRNKTGQANQSLCLEQSSAAQMASPVDLTRHGPFQNKEGQNEFRIIQKLCHHVDSRYLLSNSGFGSKVLRLEALFFNYNYNYNYIAKYCFPSQSTGAQPYEQCF